MNSISITLNLSACHIQVHTSCRQMEVVPGSWLRKIRHRFRSHKQRGSWWSHGHVCADRKKKGRNREKETVLDVKNKVYHVPSVSSRPLIVTHLQRNLQEFYLEVDRSVRSHKEPLEQESRESSQMVRKKPREDFFKKEGTVSCVKAPAKNGEYLQPLGLASASK